MEQLHICAGLPRTGSTILMNILQQNPSIFTTTTDPLPVIIQNQMLVKARQTEAFQAMSCQQADDAIYGMTIGAINGWYEGLTKKPIVISKSREWSNLSHLVPDSKTLVLVRDLRDIVESFDRVNSKIKALHTYNDNNEMYASMTEGEKFTYHFKTANSLSCALTTQLPRYITRFKNGQENIKFIRYEDLIKDPVYMLRRIYDFLGIQPHQHDLQTIEQSSMVEHDNAYFREKTDHRTHSQMKPWSEPERQWSVKTQEQIINNYSWFYEAFYPEVI